MRFSLRNFGLALCVVVAAYQTDALAQLAPGAPVTFINSSSAPRGAAPSYGNALSSADPQARVGRISLINGTVSFHTPDQDSWSYATLNYPVTGGNSFWTEPNSKAEIQAGSDAIRMDGGTEIDINELDDHGTRIEVSQGAVNLHVGNVEQGEIYQIITPHEAINILQPGTYRVQPGDDTHPDQVAVLRGRLQVGDPQTLLTVNAGETAMIQPGEPPAIHVEETAATAFDNWSLERDNYEEPRQVARYVSQETTGYEDLDRYGAWQGDPAYGAVWYPAQVQAGWVPYHYGHWVWVAPWGWTWIDDAPWGFAPFHYGRWAYVHDRWGWIPGRIAPHPVYAPALVAFIGGRGFGISIGIGDRPVGWFPLGPHEAYHPGYRVSDNYVRNVNLAHVPNVRAAYNNPASQNNFANRRFATVVSAHDFAASHPVDKAAVNVPAAKLAAAPVNATSAPTASVTRALQHQNAPHGNYVPNAQGPDRRAGAAAPAIAQPTAPVRPTVPPPPASAAAIAHAPPRDEHQTAATPTTASATAPGPVIQHRNRPADYMPSMHTAPQALSAATPSPHIQTTPIEAPHVEAPQTVHQPIVAHTELPAAHVAVQQAPRPAPRELDVPHPQQSAPLTPSHEGWVRHAPQPAAAPAPHIEAPHAEVPHGEAPHAAPEH